MLCCDTKSRAGQGRQAGTGRFAAVVMGAGINVGGSQAGTAATKNRLVMPPSHNPIHNLLLLLLRPRLFATTN